jgi:hypothetical protein
VPDNGPNTPWVHCDGTPNEPTAPVPVVTRKTAALPPPYVAGPQYAVSAEVTSASIGTP